MKRLAAVLALCLLGASPRAVEIRGMRHPALSPDGRQIAFDWHGDLWVCPVEGGEARRLTDDPADEEKPAWSPDGRRLAFSSDGLGNRDLFVLELETLKRRQLSFHSSNDDAPAWSPDGAWIAFHSDRDSNLDLPLNNAVRDLWKMPAEGGTACRITRFRGEDPAWSPDGKWIAYDRYSSGYAEGEHNIFVIAADGSGIPREIAAGGEDSRHPVFMKDRIYFSHEANGIKQASAHRNVWRGSLDGGPLVQVSGHRDGQVTWPSACANSPLVVYERDFNLYSIDATRPAAEPKKLRITTGVTFEDPVARKTLKSGFHTPVWSPSGARLAFAADGQIWTTAADGSAAQCLTTGNGVRRDPVWGPGEHSLIYLTGTTGMPGAVWEIDLSGGGPRRLTDDRPIRSADLSPDGRFLFLSEPGVGIVREARESHQRKTLLEVREGECSIVRCSPDGASLAMLVAERIVVMDLATLSTKEAASKEGKSGLSWTRDGARLAVGIAAENGSWRIEQYDARTLGRLPERSIRDARNPSWSPDDTMVVAESSRGEPKDAKLLILDAKGSERLPLEITAARDVAESEERSAVFLQVWSSYATNYYDPFFHGVDWNAMRERYRPFVESARTKAEFYDLINDMIGELHSSHIRLMPAPVPNRTATGSLAADLYPEADGTIRVRRIEAGGPADKAGLHDGDLIVGVAGKEVGPELDFDRAMSGASIPTLALEIRNEAGELLSVSVKGLDRNALRELKYENRIAARKKLTRERSGGRLAYHHIRMMNQPEVQRLKNELANDARNAEGLVLDERDGVGGLAHRPVCALLDSGVPARLNAAPVCFMRNRNGSSVPDRFGNAPTGGKSWDRPVIMIQNEIARSDKEILPFTFRALGIGYTVGMPTAGGVIGGNEWTMQDGSKIVVSVQGWFSADGRNLEGYGVPPDFRAAETHEDLLAGRDTPLEKAVDILLAQMDGKIAAPLKPGAPAKLEGQPGK